MKKTLLAIMPTAFLLCTINAQAVLLTYEFSAELNNAAVSEVVQLLNPGVLAQDIGTYQLTEFPGYAAFADANPTVSGRFSYDTDTNLFIDDFGLDGRFFLESFEYTLNVDNQAQTMSGGMPGGRVFDTESFDLFVGFNELRDLDEFEGSFFPTFDLETGNAEHAEVIHLGASLTLFSHTNTDVISSNTSLPELLNLDDFDFTGLTLSFVEPDYDFLNPQLGDLFLQTNYTLSELVLVDASDISVNGPETLSLMVMGLLLLGYRARRN